MDDSNLPIVDWSGQTVLTLAECEEHLRRMPVGRIGFVHDGSPQVLPINFVYRPGRVLFRTGLGSKLEAAVMSEPVCFEIDHWDPIEHTGWSVLVEGVADTLDELDDADGDQRRGLQPWSTPAVRQHWVMIRADVISGRQVGPGQHPAVDFVDPP